MIKYENGDILNAPTEALVNTVNCQGYMGKGIALQFKNKYPGNFSFYENKCKRGEMTVDEVLVYKEKSQYIINFATKQEWRKKSQYDFIEKGLQSLIFKVKELGIKSISIPPLGCGNGGLDWVKVHELIIKAFSQLENEIDVLIFPPKAKIEKKDNNINLKHVLVNLAYDALKTKTKYSIFTTFYLCDALLKNNDFSFSLQHGRAYSKELDDIMNYIHDIKINSKQKLSDFFCEYVRINANKEFITKYDMYNQLITKISEILNSFSDKNEYSELVLLIESIKKNETISSENANLNKELISKLISHGFIKLNLFGEFEFSYITSNRA
ncbi:macro domain-containing protein [Phytobacter diazotrophicus]|uniref:macro domain-containing protein n=1 Tax=Phytobacter diazotrophicus TaxID=395631 RepID=UPI0029358832|nr:macro domain-containing protein [Phytobacter diazotrophicus]MDV2904926.1 macro domain-containing protein [Phytobacter diazotrophicus]